MTGAIVSAATSGIATKYLVAVAPGTAAEVVRVERPEKTIVCFSTQVGCSIGCAFCASGRGGVKKSLDAAQMVLLMRAALAESPGGKPVLLSAMGEGEPSQNAGALIEALLAMAAPWTRCAVSTSGPSARLVQRLLETLDGAGLKAKVQYSLHSADPDARLALMPGAIAAPERILAVLAGRRDVELNVVLWDGANDSERDAQRVADLLHSVPTSEPWRLKLNRGNPVAGGLKPASEAAVRAWSDAIAARGVALESYETDGAEIEAACGQLRWKQASA